MSPVARSLPLGQARALAAALVGGGRGAGLTAGLMVAGALLEGVGLFILVPLAGLLVDGDGWSRTVAGWLFAAVGADSRLARLAVLLGAFAAVMVLRADVLLLRDRRLAALRLHFVERERTALIRALAGARWQDVAGLRHARVTAALGADILRVAAAAHFLLQSAVSAVMLIAQWVLTLLIAPPLAALAAVLLVVAAALTVPSLRRAARVGDDLSAGQIRMLDAAGQFLAGLKAAKAVGAGSAFAADVASDARLLTERQLAFERRQSVVRVAVASGSALVGAALLLVGVWSAVPIAQLLAAIVVLSRMSGPALQIGQAVQQLATLLPAHAGLVELRRQLTAAAGPPVRDDPAAEGTEGAVVFDHVSYAHPGGGGVDRVDLVLRPGEMVGLVGESGAGKTTLVDLLAGLLTPDTGRVLLAGRPPVAGDRTVAYVTQDGFLIHDTVRRNLMLGGAPREEAALWQALARVGADAIVSALPAGLDTLLGERGSRLSGGERQRIGLARALLRSPALLILDEATNAIDVGGERRILDALASDPDRPAVVMIAHRAESLARCDRVITLRGGRVIDDRPGADGPTRLVSRCKMSD